MVFVGKFILTAVATACALGIVANAIGWLCDHVPAAWDWWLDMRDCKRAIDREGE